MTVPPIDLKSATESPSDSEVSDSATASEVGVGEDLDGSRRSQLAYVAGTAFVALVVLTVIARRSLAIDFYFDEMWRYDMVRDASPRARALLHDTPIPPGWLYAMHYLLAPLPASRSVARVVALVPSALGLALLADVLRMVAQRSGAVRHHARLIAALSVWAACCIPAIAAVNVYFNNYGAELLGGALLIWAAARVQLRGARPALLLTVAAVLPLFTQGALLMVPALVVLWRRGHLSISPRTAVVTGAAMATTASLSWLFFYRPLTSGNLVNYWSGERFGAGGLGSFIAHSSRQFTSAFVPSRDQSVGALAIIATVVALAVGVVLIARGCWSFLAFVLCGQLGAIAASVVVAWPATPVRVNLAFLAPIATLIPFGALMLVWRALRGHVRNTLVVSVVLVSVTIAAAPLIWPTSITVNGTASTTFARGLTDDLRVVANLSGSRVVVVSYHPMTHWYVDDVFRHDPPHQMDVTVLRETLDGLVYTDVDRLVGAALLPGTDVWCVVPYEVGPDATERACDLHLPMLTEFYRERMGRALVVGFRSNP